MEVTYLKSYGKPSATMKSVLRNSLSNLRDYPSRSVSVQKEVLEKKGVNPKAQRLILKDLEEITEESVNNWLEDNGDLFGLTQPEANQEKELNRAALRQQDMVTQLGMTPDRAEDMSMRIANAESAEEIINMIYGSQ